ncbi:pantetheine-phosphate adenylyltransferase [bacterium]|nr:pantetheine-phosphate adenylyltransferase [bacterium]
MKIAVYPGTFDPITNGHLDIIKRASQIFKRVIVAVSENPHKKPIFSMEERRQLIQDAVIDLDNVDVDVFDGLLVHYAQKKGISVLIRGLRVLSDFEYEFQMALMNRKLMPTLETIYFMPSEEFTYINSTIVKEVARLGGEIGCFLPPGVVKALHRKIKEIKK